MVQMHLYAVFAASAAYILAASSGATLAILENTSLPTFAFSWLNDKDTYEAGDVATIRIKVFGDMNKFKLDGYALNLTLTVNGKRGNSSYISGVSSNLERDSANWSISFVPIVVGTFNVIINDPHFEVSDSSLHFKVLPGQLYPSVCVVSWMGLVNEFIAGEIATVFILPKDAFGNNISSTSKEPSSYKFNLSAFSDNGSSASLLNVTYMGWDGFGYVGIKFIVATAGSLSLHVGGGNQTLNGFPLPFYVKPGPMDITKCVAKWKYDTNNLQIFSKLEMFIYQQDQFGNLVPGLYAFDAQVVEKWTSLSIPVADLFFEETAPGVQLFSFSVLEPGGFLLTILDMDQNQSISNMPCDFNVFVGYCDGVSSIVNGSGLAASVAGETSRFSVYLRDNYQYPSPVEVEELRVQVVRDNDFLIVLPSIYPIQIVNGSEPTYELSYGASGLMAIAPAPSVDMRNISGANLKIQSSAFDVFYTPNKSGIYEIRVFCGNIPLNGDHYFKKEVRAGGVDMELSQVLKFTPKVPKMFKNEIVVQLMDSFSNPVLSQQSKLKLEIGSINHSGFLSWMFVDNKDGLYSGYYVAEDVGTYEICASFDGKRLFPCPFGVNVYSSCGKVLGDQSSHVNMGEYFPKAWNGTVSVWEDESVAFDVLENSYFAGGNASIVESSLPHYGSLLQYGQLFRYTPHKGFFGDDAFSYTISDINGNIVSGSVIISVLSSPPQFISLPARLQASEDVICPRIGGFSGFAISYSDPMENISVILSAKSGTLFLSPIRLQLWQSKWSGLSVEKMNGSTKDLILGGHAEVINLSLQSIQYLGNNDFSGDDVIHVRTMNKNGINTADVPVFVEPINDPPFIHVPEYIILENNQDEASSLIYDKQKDKFEFSIEDPDLFYFPGNEYLFMVMLSMEVNSGLLITRLPADLINSTELKLNNNYQWQPLQTFVTISEHFSVRGKGIRFRGTIKECNDVMQNLVYQGGDHGAVLTVAVNDMGNYGCYPDCAEMMSTPLFAEASVNLIRRRPMTSLVAHTLGSAIVIEFTMMLSFGVILLFFICKCAIVLGKERRKLHSPGIKISRNEGFNEGDSSRTSSENMTYFTGCCSSPFLFRLQPPDFHQRLQRRTGYGECSKDEGYQSSQSS